MRVKRGSKILLHEVYCELGELSHVLVRILTLHELNGGLLLKIDTWNSYSDWKKSKWRISPFPFLLCLATQ